MGVFRRVQPTLGRADECHLPERAVDPSFDQTHAKVVCLLGREITVNHNTGIFITMNPATKGYGGRQKLPVNLKQLFRPVTMSVPDNELIAEVNHGPTQCGVVLAVDEALNGVLDDNHLLTMPNGKRIQFGINVNLIFEAYLRFASPATISRLSVIFLSEEDVDVKPTIASWITQQPPECQGSLATQFDSTFHGALDWIYKGPGGGQLATETQLLACSGTSWDTGCLDRRKALEKTRSSLLRRLISFLLCAGALLAISQLT